MFDGARTAWGVVALGRISELRNLRLHLEGLAWQVRLRTQAAEDVRKQIVDRVCVLRVQCQGWGHHISEDGQGSLQGWLASGTAPADIKARQDAQQSAPPSYCSSNRRQKNLGGCPHDTFKHLQSIRQACLCRETTRMQMEE